MPRVAAVAAPADLGRVQATRIGFRRLLDDSGSVADCGTRMEPLAGAQCDHLRKSFWALVRPIGLEPITFGSGAKRGRLQHTLSRRSIGSHDDDVTRSIERAVKPFFRCHVASYAVRSLADLARCRCAVDCASEVGV